MVTRTVELPGDKIEVHADIGPGRIVRAVLLIEDATAEAKASDPSSMSFEEWDRNFNEMIAMAPVNDHPCDDSREAIYGPDPGSEDDGR